MTNQFVLSLPESELRVLREALFYVDIPRLKMICGRYRLPVLGGKALLIARIAHFAGTRQIVEVPPYPEISCARPNETYPLELDAYMLYGSFKTDDTTRSFLRRFIGQYFHFTSFSHDWLRMRWYVGNPPTYREFIRFWEYEFLLREQGKKTTNQDWGYVHFVLNYTCKYPEIRSTEIATEWRALRNRKAGEASSLMDKVI
jgi:hypothetical protein